MTKCSSQLPSLSFMNQNHKKEMKLKKLCRGRIRKNEKQLTSCTFSGLWMLEPRRPPPLLPLPSEAEAAENRLSSSEMSISGAL